MLRELELLPLWRLRAPPLNVAPLDKVVNQAADEKIDAAESPMIAPKPELIEPIQLVAEVAHVASMPAMRLLVSEDANCLFLLESIVDNTEAETLLHNMLRAISVKISADISQANITQLTQYQTKIIIAFGEVAAQALLGNALSFDALRLNQHQQALAIYSGTPVIITYHPTDLLQHLPDKAKAWDDLRLAMQIVQNN